MPPHAFIHTALWVLGILLILRYLLHFRKVRYPGQHRDYSTRNRQANLLALAYLVVEPGSSQWNDPTGDGNGAEANALIREQWGLHNSQDVYDKVMRLLTVRHHRDSWQRLLAARAAAVRALGGRKPSEEEWLEAIRDVGGTREDEAVAFIRAIHHYEEELGPEAFPRNEPVLSLDAFALAQAVAVARWSVGLGLITVPESMGLIERVNEAARSEFQSWEAFGSSFLLGEVMELTGGAATRDGLKTARKSLVRLNIALDDEFGGAWNQLPWALQDS